MSTRTAILTVIVVGAAVLYSMNRPLTGKIVVTKHGALQGTISSSRDGRKFYEWRGIPYAQAPVGKLRFASPVPFGSWRGVRDARYVGSVCTQINPITYAVSGSEDCLFLNVYSPVLEEKSKNLPVLVSIHGGGFNLFSGDQYKPYYLMDEDVIVVSLNYRLGVFGFLNTGDVSIRGNMGLKDQVLAFQWIKTNIEIFGGDPDQITIFGESAGGASVHYMLLSPKTEGLFQKAISFSGVAGTFWSFERLDQAVKHTRKFSTNANCTQNGSTELVACLRSKSADELIAAYFDDAISVPLIKPHEQGHWFCPSVEAVNDSEAFLVQTPWEIIKRGHARRIPWLVGMSNGEGIMSTVRFRQDLKYMDLFESNLNSEIKQRFGVDDTDPRSSDIVRKIHEFYFPNASTFNTEQKIQLFEKMFSDSQFYLQSSYASSLQRKFSPVYLAYLSRPEGPSCTPIALHFQDGQSLMISVIQYLLSYFFNQIILGKEVPSLGVDHGDAFLYIFYDIMLLSIPKSDSANYKFSKDMVKLFVDFAKNEKIQFRGVEFQPVNKTGTMKYLDLCEEPALIDEPFQDRMTFLKSLQFLK